MPVVFAYCAVTSLPLLYIGIFLVAAATIAQFSFWGNYLPRVYPIHLRGTGKASPLTWRAADRHDVRVGYRDIGDHTRSGLCAKEARVYGCSRRLCGLSRRIYCFLLASRAEARTTPRLMIAPSTPELAREQLDAHTREIVRWHFSAETGCPFWLDWARKAGWNPAEEITSFDDIIARFPPFEEEWLRDLQPELWVPRNTRADPSISSRPEAPRACLNSGSAGTITGSITVSSVRGSATSISRETITG